MFGGSLFFFQRMWFGVSAWAVCVWLTKGVQCLSTFCYPNGEHEWGLFNVHEQHQLWSNHCTPLIVFQIWPKWWLFVITKKDHLRQSISKAAMDFADTLSPFTAFVWTFFTVLSFVSSTFPNKRAPVMQSVLASKRSTEESDNELHLSFPCFVLCLLTLQLLRTSWKQMCFTKSSGTSAWGFHSCGPEESMMQNFLGKACPPCFVMFLSKIAWAHPSDCFVWTPVMKVTERTMLVVASGTPVRRWTCQSDHLLGSSSLSWCWLVFSQLNWALHSSHISSNHGSTFSCRAVKAELKCEKSQRWNMWSDVNQWAEFNSASLFLALFCLPMLGHPVPQLGC